MSLRPELRRTALPGCRGRWTIDTSAATNTDEQTHAIGVGSGFCATAGGCTSGVSDVTIQDVGFRHPVATDGSRKGGCVRLLGQSPALPVVRVTIAGSSFTDCARTVALNSGD